MPNIEQWEVVVVAKAKKVFKVARYTGKDVIQTMVSQGT